MSKNVSLEAWRDQIARSKKLNKQLAEAKEATVIEEAPATEPVKEAPVVSQEPDVAPVSAEAVADEVNVPVEEAAVETEAAPEVTSEDPNWTDGVTRSEVVREAMVVAAEAQKAEEVVAAEAAQIVEETAAPEVQEEPAEEVSVTTEAPEVTSEPPAPVENKVAEAIEKLTKGTQSKAGMIYTRVDRPVKRYKAIFNEGLRRFCADAIMADNAPQQVTLRCFPVRKSNKLGIWEEGGAYNNKGNVLMVTDAYGNPKEAISAYHDSDVYNGKHAFIPISMYDHVVLGVADGDKKIIGVYHVSQISPITKDGGTITCNKVVTLTPLDDENNKIRLAQNLTEYETKWMGKKEDEDIHPVLNKVLTVADEALHTTELTHPIYIKDYSHYHLNSDDYWNVLQDADYISKLVTYPDMATTYAALDEAFAKLFSEVDTSGKDSVVITTLNLIKTKSGKEVLVAFISGLLYSRQTNSSAEANGGGRFFYGRVILNPETKFYYPDTSPEKSVSYETILDLIKKRYVRPDGNYDILVTALRRMK